MFVSPRSEARVVALFTFVALGAAPAALADADIVAAARAQVGVTVTYDPAYRKLAFPGGDVPADRGVCTDVIVRALRVARSLDLQQRVNEDLRSHRYAYPRRWGPRGPIRTSIIVACPTS